MINLLLATLGALYLWRLTQLRPFRYVVLVWLTLIAMLMAIHWTFHVFYGIR